MSVPDVSPPGASTASSKSPKVPLLSALECIKLQLDNVIGEAGRMRGLEFPYRDSRDALEVIISQCKRQRDYLGRLAGTSPPRTVEAVCRSTADYLLGTHDFLGFILRSTNTRNAFEVYGPLLRLATAFIGPSAKLLLSSEWEFSPFLLLNTQQLPSEFVLIGQSATESSNPFVVPLAAHELGHSVWHNQKVWTLFSKEVSEDIAAHIAADWENFKREFGLSCDKNDLQNDFAGGRQIWLKAVELCRRQMEELFCDLFGFRLFGTSYLHAFAYLLAPAKNRNRSPYYPTLSERVEFHINAAQVYGYEVPDDYRNAFGRAAVPGGNQDRNMMLLAAADAVRKKHAPALIGRVNTIVAEHYPIQPTRDATRKCEKAFYFLMPVQSAPSMADIANASWNALLSDSPFCLPHLNENKAANLIEVTLKSFEIFELERCLEDAEVVRAASK